MIGLRLRAPVFARALALLVLIAGVVFVSISYYRMRNNKPFRMRSEAAELSKQVVAVVEGYERRITKGDRLHILLRAARDITYSDGHHELEDVHLEVYPETGDRPDKISARRTISNEGNTLISFTGDVNIETRDRLMPNRSDRLRFSQRSGRGFGAARVRAR